MDIATAIKVVSALLSPATTVFIVSLFLRDRLVKGTRPYGVYDYVVVSLRPLVRPLVVVLTPLRAVTLIADGDHVGLALALGSAGITWWLAGQSLDGDDGDGISGSLRRLRQRLSRSPQPTLT